MIYIFDAPIATGPILITYNSMHPLRLSNRPIALSWLEDFLSLYECGSFSRAAEQRHLAQPALSRHILSLEEWVGVALVDRSTHPISLTEAGRQFQPLVEDLLHRLALARETAQAAAEVTAVTLRFAATHALSLTFFPVWLRQLESRLQPVRIHLISDSFQACEDMMLQKRTHFLLCHHHPAVANRLNPAEFESIVVGTDTLIPVAAPESTGKSAFPLADLNATRLPVLVYSEESVLGRIMQKVCGTKLEDARLEPVFTAHLAVVLKLMALEGRGVAWLPRSLIDGELRDKRLVEAGDEGWHVPMDICLFRHRTEQTSTEEAFWKVLQPSSDSNAESR